MSFSLPTILWLIWTIALAAWVLVSSILVYHWQSYSAQDPKMRVMRLIYFVGSVLLFASATTFIFSL